MRLKEQRASLENDRLRAENDLQAADDQFSKVGGKYWEQRESLRDEQRELEAREKQLKACLIALAAGELPLALAPELLDSALRQDRREREAKEAAIVQRLLEERDEQVADALAREDVSEDVTELLRELQAQDRQARQFDHKVERRLSLSDRAHGQLEHLLSDSLPQRLGEVRQLVEELNQVAHNRESIDRSLTATPREDAVKEAAEQLQHVTKQAALLNDQAKRLDSRIDVAKRAVDETEKKLAKLIQAQIESEIKGEETIRMASLARQTREIMGRFLTRATEAKIDHLSALVTESFRFLLRKKTLVQQVHIDPSSFAISLYDSDGRQISKQRLSEGEKQIFAISVLWGLARAASRSLPAIVDTPMARLDAKHRNHLVERYFPNASHQVIILSTDTEVDRQYYQSLQPHIARAYHLKYDEQRKVSIAEEGYFWEENLLGAGGAAK